MFSEAETERLARRATVCLGDLPLEVFMLPDGSYVLSQTQTAEVIGKPELSIRQFLNSKGFKLMLGLDPESGICSESIAVEGVNKPIAPVPLRVAGLYWRHWARNRSAPVMPIFICNHR